MHFIRSITNEPISGSHQFRSSILKEYDIRGVVGETLFEKDAYWVGRCFGHRVRENNGNSVAVCRDGRLSSPQLENALIKGLCETGVDTYQLGVGPTPLLYFSEYALPIDAAIMVTGSHNPPAHNGFKMTLKKQPFFGEEILNFQNLIKEKLYTGQGKVYESCLSSLYVENLLKNITFEKNLKVAWDPGNGATAEIIKILTEMIPGKHVLLNCKIDGTFPNHSPDTSNSANLFQLQQAVIKENCDVGVAFDGDGDRLAAVDNKGHILLGDQLLSLFVRDLLTREPTAKIISDIKTSQGFFDEVSRLGGNAIMWKTGHSHIKSKMRELGASLAGEVSGHFFFKENYYGFDDGIYAALKLIEILSHSSQTFAELHESLPHFSSTSEIRIPCDSEKKIKAINNIKSRLPSQGLSFIDIDGIRVQFDQGWWLLRASHTQDVLVCRCESYTREGLEHIKKHLKNELSKEQIFDDCLL